MQRSDILIFGIAGVVLFAVGMSVSAHILESENNALRFSNNELIINSVGAEKLIRGMDCDSFVKIIYEDDFTAFGTRIAQATMDKIGACYGYDKVKTSFVSERTSVDQDTSECNYTLDGNFDGYNGKICVKHFINNVKKENKD